MLDLANDIRSLSDFKRNTVELLDRLRKTGHPLVLTINGKAEVVVQDAAAYQTLLDRLDAIEGIQRGLADVKAGRAAAGRGVVQRSRAGGPGTGPAPGALSGCAREFRPGQPDSRARLRTKTSRLSRLLHGRPSGRDRSHRAREAWREAAADSGRAVRRIVATVKFAMNLNAY